MHGVEQVKIWRRSYATPPPALDADDPTHPRFERRYGHLSRSDLPSAESLKTTLERVLPYWHDTVAPVLARGETVMIAAHGNSLRALVKYLDGISEEDILELNIPTGLPLIYDLEADSERKIQPVPRRRANGEGRRRRRRQPGGTLEPVRFR